MSEPTATSQPPATVEASTPLTPHPITIEVKVRLQALAVPEPGGGYSVAIPALPGCTTEGDDIEDVKANIIEAAELWLESQHDLRSAEALKAMAE